MGSVGGELIDDEREGRPDCTLSFILAGTKEHYLWRQTHTLVLLHM